MKVLHVETGKHLYGGPLQVYYLMRGLAECDQQNILVCSNHSAIAELAKEVASNVHSVPMSGDLDLEFLFRLRRIIRAERPDIIHLHSRRGTEIIGAIASRLEKRPVILSRRVDNPEPRWLVKLKYRLYHKVITISEGIKKVLLKEGVAIDKLVCVPSAVDTQTYNAHRDREWFQQHFNIKPEQPVIGVIAQLILRKGHRYLLQSIPQILSRYPDTQFLFFGQGPLTKQIQKEIIAQQLQNNVHLMGFREDIEKIMPNLDIVAHPAEMEGLGVSLLQAAACSIPIVASAVGGIPEIVKNNVNGILVPPKNQLALSDSILSLLENPERARTMGEAGRNIVEQKFSIEAMVQGNLAVYQSLISS